MNNEKGQSTIEFLLSFGFTIGILFLYIQLALNAGGAYLAHYATFMAARSYLVWDNGGQEANSDSNAENKAKTVFESFNVKELGINDPKSYFKISSLRDQDQRKFLHVGAVFEFSQKMSFINFVGGDIKAKMRAESYMGREPTRHLCQKRVCYSMHERNSCRSVGFSTLFDNGC